MSAYKRFPVVTLLLIAANLMAAFALIVDPDIAYEYGFRANSPSVLTALTSLFLHANLIHLLGNMVFLAAVGAAVEMASGSFRFASVYLLGGLAGVIVHFLIMRKVPDTAPLMGASGAITGCAGYYCVRYIGLRVPIAPKISVSVAAVTGVWLFLQIVGAFVRFGQQGGTAYWAHLGGFVAGIFMSAVFRAPDLGQVRLGHEVLEQMNKRGPMAACTAAKRHLEKHPKDVTALTTLARACAQMNDEPGEADAILKLLDLEAESEHPALLARLVEIHQADRLTEHRRTMLAEKFKEGHPATARALLISVLQESSENNQRPEALLALYALDRERDPEHANALLDELMGNFPLHPCADLARKRGWVL